MAHTARALGVLGLLGPLLLAASLVLVHSAHLPSSFKRCARQERDVDGCLQDALQKVIKVIGNGVSSLGIPKLDPLEIKELAISSNPSGPKGPVSLDITLKDVKVYHIFANSTTMHHPKFNIGSYQGRCAASLQRLQIDAEYEMKGRVLVLPLTGKGPFNMTMKDAEIVFDIQFDPITKRDGKTYARVKDFKIDLSAKDYKVNFANLVSSTDKSISDNLNVFINQNLDIVYSELKPAVDEGVAAAFTVYTNKIFNKVPWDEIFPQKL